MSQDRTVKDTYSIGLGLNPKNELYQDERIKTCDDPHRQLSLEDIAFKYQLEQFEGEPQDEIRQRQEIVGKILDTHYNRLPAQSLETDADKTWRLYLARMDSRRMKTEVKERDGTVVVTFNPEIDPSLRKYSEASTAAAAAALKHMPLKLWATYKFSNTPEHQQYKTFEEHTETVIAETREILDQLEKAEDTFPIFNRSIPPYTCSVLIRDFGDRLSAEDKEFCRDVIIHYAKHPLTIQNYQYQIDDGTEPSISTLPMLMKHFPEESIEIKSLLMLLLLSPWREIVASAARGVVSRMWESHRDDAQGIFLGCLLLRPKYNELRKEILSKERANGVYDTQEAQVLEIFKKRYEVELAKVATNKIAFTDLQDLSNLGLTTLEVAFELIPPNTQLTDHKAFLHIFLPLSAHALGEDRDEVAYSVKQRFIRQFAHFILCSSEGDILTYLQPFIDNLADSRDYVNLLQEFISVEDELDHYDEFWIVWNALYDSVVKTCEHRGSRSYPSELIHNYLLAWPYWKPDVKEWHTLKEREKGFYKRISEDIGDHPSVLYSISIILNGVGSTFIDDGLVWISNMLRKNPQYTSMKLETNTVYYIETLMRRYVLVNRQRIRTTPSLRDQVIAILNFLFEKGSTAGYLLREDIL